MELGIWDRRSDVYQDLLFRRHAVLYGQSPFAAASADNDTVVGLAAISFASPYPVAEQPTSEFVRRTQLRLVSPADDVFRSRMRDSPQHPDGRTDGRRNWSRTRRSPVITPDTDVAAAHADKSLCRRRCSGLRPPVDVPVWAARSDACDVPNGRDRRAPESRRPCCFKRLRV